MQTSTHDVDKTYKQLDVKQQQQQQQYIDINPPKLINHWV
jgi:hypothetical protein